MQEIKKIVIIGPESTGKSTLCKELASHYNTLWCPEFAREYLLENGTNYTYDNLLTIAKGQLQLEDEFADKVRGLRDNVGNNRQQTINPKPFFIDTNMYVMKVWCEFVFEKCHQFILDEIGKRDYNLYLLMDVDLPWTKDELREYPDFESREKLYHIYKDIMLNQHTPWVSISGSNEERLHHAITAVEKHLLIG